MSYYTSYSDLYHYGIKGQKWGTRRYQNKDGGLTPAGKKRYSSTGIRSALARRQNEKIDKSFDDWKINAKKREDAIALGKKASEARLAYEKNPGDKQLKKAYKESNREYKKALNSNTTYRKGQVKKEVGSDLSRKYLSEAKKVKKQMDANPADKSLQKKYNDLMSKHDVERAKARRAPEIAQNRSRKIASIKRAMTISVKTAATTAALAGGAYAVNRYLTNHNVTINGKSVSANSDAFMNAVKVGREILKYI